MAIPKALLPTFLLDPDDCRDVADLIDEKADADEKAAAEAGTGRVVASYIRKAKRSAVQLRTLAKHHDGAA